MYTHTINLYMIHKHDDSACNIFNWFLYVIKALLFKRNCLYFEQIS